MRQPVSQYSAPVLVQQRRPAVAVSITIWVRDLKRMTCFYRDLLGFQIVADDATSPLVLQLGTTQLVLEERVGSLSRARRAEPMWFTTTITDTQAGLVTVARSGASAAESSQIGPAGTVLGVAVACTDPEGNRVEVGWTRDVAARATIRHMTDGSALQFDVDDARDLPAQGSCDLRRADLRLSGRMAAAPASHAFPAAVRPIRVLAVLPAAADWDSADLAA